MCRHYLLGEDILQGESHGGQQGRDQTSHVEGDLGDGGDGHPQENGDQTQVDQLRLSFAKQDPGQDHREQRHGGFHCNISCTNTFNGTVPITIGAGVWGSWFMVTCVGIGDRYFPQGYVRSDRGQELAQ